MRRLNSFKNSIRPWLSVHRESGVAPIILSGIPRGGSTWIMEILGALDGVRTIAEPFNLRLPRISRELGCNTWGKMLDDLTRMQRISFIKRIQRNELKFLNPNPFVQRRFLTKRTLYKVIHLPAMIAEDVSMAVGGKFLCLLRHPIPVSLSREVFPILNDFEISTYRKEFSEQQLRLADRIIATGSHLEQGVLAWCLHFEPYLRKNTVAPAAPIITYEACVTETKKTLSRMQLLLHEDFPEDLRQRALTPSRVLSKSDPQTQAVLKGQNRGPEQIAYLVGRWQERISRQDVDLCQSILDAFEITFYQANNAMPLLNQRICGND